MMMRWSTLRYLFKEGIIGLWRNRTMALASIGTIVLCLIILGVSYGIGSNIDYIIAQIESKFGITAYLKDGLSEKDMLSLKNQVEKMSEVDSVIYISKEEALKSFSEDNDDENLFAMFKEDNPLPASLEITTKDIKDQPAVIKKLEGLKEQGIDETVYFQNETATFINIRNTINYICYGILICLVVVGLMLMSNTIKLTVFIRKREINIMKYVGATDYFIQVPFLIEGVLIGLIGSLISILTVTLAYDWVRDNAAKVSGVLGEIALLPTESIMSVLLPMFLGLGIGIGLIGSLVAIHRHLKV